MADVIVFLLGVHFCIMLLAACYRIVDLWYRIGDFLSGIIAKIAVLTALDVGIFLLLPDHLPTVFVAGQLAYLALHIALFVLTRFAIMLIESRYR